VKHYDIEKEPPSFFLIWVDHFKDIEEWLKVIFFPVCFFVCTLWYAVNFEYLQTFIGQLVSVKKKSTKVFLFFDRQKKKD